MKPPYRIRENDKIDDLELYNHNEADDNRDDNDHDVENDEY